MYAGAGPPRNWSMRTWYRSELDPLLPSMALLQRTFIKGTSDRRRHKARWHSVAVNRTDPRCPMS